MKETKEMKQSRKNFEMWGTMETGRHALMRKIAKKLKIKVMDIKLTGLQEGDLRGMPYIATSKNAK
jgi:hypothetical protein